MFLIIIIIIIIIMIMIIKHFIITTIKHVKYILMLIVLL